MPVSEGGDKGSDHRHHCQRGPHSPLSRLKIISSSDLSSCGVWAWAAGGAAALVCCLYAGLDLSPGHGGSNYRRLCHFITLHDMSGMDGAGGPGKSSPPVPVCRLGGGGGPARTWGRGPMLPRCRSHGLRGFSLRVSRSAPSISLSACH